MTSIQFSPAQNNWLEATWTDVEQLPDVVTPAKPALFDAEGNEVQAAQPETTTPGGTERRELAHTSYHPTQLGLLQADAAAMGTPLDEYTDMLEEWVAAYVPPPPAPPAVPQQVTAFQAKAALLHAGLLDDVEAMIKHDDTPRVIKLAWDETLHFERTSPTVATIAAALQLTDAQIDALFITASEITA